MTQNVLKDFIKAAKGLPAYAVVWVFGLIALIFSDVTVTTLALVGVFVGLALGDVFWGFATFFIAYSVARLVANLSQAIGFGLRGVADSLFLEED